MDTVPNIPGMLLIAMALKRKGEDELAEQLREAIDFDDTYRVSIRFAGSFPKRFFRLMMLLIKGWCYAD